MLLGSDGGFGYFLILFMMLFCVCDRILDCVDRVYDWDLVIDDFCCL